MQAETPPCFINFRLPPDLFRRLDEAARAVGITRAEMLRQRIRDLEVSGSGRDQDRAA